MNVTSDNMTTHHCVMVEEYTDVKHRRRYRLVDADNPAVIVSDCQSFGFGSDEKAVSFAKAHKNMIVVPNPRSRSVEMSTLF